MATYYTHIYGDSKELKKVLDLLTDSTKALVLVENSVKSYKLNFYIYLFDSEEQARKNFEGITVKKGGYMKHYMPAENFPSFVEKVEAVRKALYYEF